MAFGSGVSWRHRGGAAAVILLRIALSGEDLCSVAADGSAILPWQWRDPCVRACNVAWCCRLVVLAVLSLRTPAVLVVHLQVVLPGALLGGLVLLVRFAAFGNAVGVIGSVVGLTWMLAHGFGPA